MGIVISDRNLKSCGGTGPNEWGNRRQRRKRGLFFSEKIRMVTLEETEDYRHDMNRAAGLLGLGVFCCILSIGMITGLAGFGMPGLTLGIVCFSCWWLSA